MNNTSDRPMPFPEQYREYLRTFVDNQSTEVGAVVDYGEWMDRRLRDQLVELARFHKLTPTDLDPLVLQQKQVEAGSLHYLGMVSQIEYLMRDCSHDAIFKAITDIVNKDTAAECT